jgi:uncharacterized protein (TIGR02285 family)
MAHKGLLIVALFWAFSLINAAYAQDKPTIRWLTWQQVPNFITTGPFAGQGLGDQITLAIQKQLPQYQHKNVISNANRYHSLIRQPDVCVAWAWTVPGSEEYRLHSRPVSLAPRTGILTLKSKSHLFGKAGDVLSLKSLLENPALTLGYLKAMTYTKDVHTLLDKYKLQGNIFTSARSDVQFDLKMLDTKRVDYFFAFPSQPIFNAKTKGINNHYQFFHIEEINKYTAMFSHCSKTEFGQNVMNQLDKILTDDFLLKHLDVIERWNGHNQPYRDVFMDYVIKQSPHPQVSNPGE